MFETTRTPKHIGNAVRRRRRRLGLTQNDVAKRTDLRQATVSGLETGQSDARLGTLLTVLAVLDLELAIRPRTKSSVKDIEGLF